MIVWGGNQPGGGRYNPKTDKWSAVSTSGAPENAWSSSAVWTGKEMVVFGGGTNGGPTNDGGRYNPSTDTWSPLSTINRPTGRTYHTATWTGAQMILLGGDDSSGIPAGDAFTYDPASDVWAKWNANTFIRESQFDSHCAAWTGSTVIAWGGRDTSGALINTGLIFDPQNKGTIAALAPAGAPTARSDMRCVWSGTQLIMWGGSGSGGAVATGGRTRSSGTAGWDALPTSPLAARDRHSMIWTGADVIMYGGIGSGSTPFADGARYSPSSNTWTAIASYTPGRYLQTTVWTGQEMIIWGGSDANENVQTGARYVP
jgi:N-acetylneuraminic acid mutarotase